MKPVVRADQDNMSRKHQINCLSNFCFISKAENKKLGGAAPSQYQEKMPSDSKTLREILSAALCPSDMFDDEYEKYLEQRTALLLERAKEHMSGA